MENNNKLVIFEYDDRYAQAVADFWNEAKYAWPEGAFGDVPFTAERIREDMKREKLITLYLARYENANKIIGYCSFKEYNEEKGISYIPLLSGHPDYLGKGIGKALLKKTVEKATEIGFKRLDLHTWSGNLKAVPLYKKVGFFWNPGTTVHMVNFLPQILNHALCKEYFQKHDWYDTYVRELKIEEDEIKQKEVKVYPHHWEQDGDMLKVIIDRESNAIIGLENNEFAVSSEIETSKIPISIPQKICWSIKNKKQNPLNISLSSFGEKGISIDKTISITVKHKQIIQSEFVVHPDVEKTMEHRTGNLLTSLLTINGNTVKMQNGLRPKPALKFSCIDTTTYNLPINKKSTIVINVENFCNRDVSAKIRLVPEQGLTISKNIQEIKLSPYEKSGFDVEITAKSVGNHKLDIISKIKIDNKEYQLENDFVNFFVSELSGFSTFRKENWILLYTPEFRIFSNEKIGNITIAKNDKTCLSLYPIQLGPPFENEVRKFGAEVNCQIKTDTAMLCVEYDSMIYSGMKIKHYVEIGLTGIFKQWAEIYNYSDEDRTFQANSINYLISKDPDILYYPFREGICKIDYPDLIGWDGEGLDYPPDKMAENWSMVSYCSESSIQKSEFRIGHIWQQAEKITHTMNSVSKITSPKIMIPAGQVRTTPAEYFLIGNFTMDYLRKLAYKFTGKNDDTLKMIEHVNLLAELPHIFTHQSELPFSLELITKEKKQVELSIKGTNLVKAELNKKIELFDNSHPIKGEVKLLSKALDNYADIVHLVYQDNWRQREFELPVIHIAKHCKLDICQKDKVFSLNNGIIDFSVADDFLPTLNSLKVDGKEFLNSSYPEITEFVWTKPWVGGIQPLFTKRYWGINAIFKNKYKLQSIEIQDNCKRKWSGFQFSGKFELPEEIKGIDSKIQYLTLPGANFVLCRTIVENNTKRFQDITSGINIYPSIAGDKIVDIVYTSFGRRYFDIAGRGTGYPTIDGWFLSRKRGIEQQVLCLIPDSPKGFLFDYENSGSGSHWKKMYHLKPADKVVIKSCIVIGKNLRKIADTYHKLLNVEFE